MKRGTCRHPKVLRLMRKLKTEQATAVGMLAMMWEWVGEYRPEGDVTGVEEELAAAAGWQGDAGTFIEAMIQVRLIDELPGEPAAEEEQGLLGNVPAKVQRRLVIHDWEEHCEEYIKKKIKRIREHRRQTESAERQKTADNGSLRGSLPSHAQPSLAMPCQDPPPPGRAGGQDAAGAAVGGVKAGNGVGVGSGGGLGGEPEERGLAKAAAAGGGTAGGLTGLQVGLNALVRTTPAVRELTSNAAVRNALAERGVQQPMLAKLSARKDLTPEIVQRTYESVLRDASADDPAAVLVHRLNSKSFA